jgi:hypothetical protein
MNTLNEELAHEAKKAAGLAVKNYYLAFVCLLAALVLNGLAVVFVATDVGSKGTRAALTALPGLLILANQVFKFDLRSRWWWLKHHKADALLRALRDQGATVGDVSQSFSRLQLESERDYPAFDITPLRQAVHAPREP